MATLELTHNHSAASTLEPQTDAKDTASAPPRATKGQPLQVASVVSELQGNADLKRQDREAWLVVSLILVSIIALGCLLMIGTVFYCSL